MARTTRRQPRRSLKKKDYNTYGAALNGPVTTIKTDGTMTVTPAATRTELNKIILKGQKRVTLRNKKVRKRLKASAK